MSDLELEEFDLGPTPSVHEILQTWFGTTDITEQTHQDCVCQIVRKALELERELAEEVAARKTRDNEIAEFIRQRDQWREVAQWFLDLHDDGEFRDDEGCPIFIGDVREKVRKLKEASK